MTRNINTDSCKSYSPQRKSTISSIFMQFKDPNFMKANNTSQSPVHIAHCRLYFNCLFIILQQLQAIFCVKIYFIKDLSIRFTICVVGISNEDGKFTTKKRRTREKGISAQRVTIKI